MKTQKFLFVVLIYLVTIFCIITGCQKSNNTIVQSDNIKPISNNKILNYQEVKQGLINSGAIQVPVDPKFLEGSKESDYRVESFQIDGQVYVLYIFTDATSNSFIEKELKCDKVYEVNTVGGITRHYCSGDGNSCYWAYDSLRAVLILIVCEEVS